MYLVYVGDVFKFEEFMTDFTIFELFEEKGVGWDVTSKNREAASVNFEVGEMVNQNTAVLID